MVPRWPRAWVPAPLVATPQTPPPIHTLDMLRSGSSRPAAHTEDSPSGREGGGTWCLLKGESRCPGHCAHPPHPPPFLPKGSSLPRPRANCHASCLGPAPWPRDGRSRAAGAETLSQCPAPEGRGDAVCPLLRARLHRGALCKHQQLFQKVRPSQAAKLGPAWTRLPPLASGCTGTSHPAFCRVSSTRVCHENGAAAVPGGSAPHPTPPVACLVWLSGFVLNEFHRMLSPLLGVPDGGSFG